MGPVQQNTESRLVPNGYCSYLYPSRKILAMEMAAATIKHAIAATPLLVCPGMSLSFFKIFKPKSSRSQIKNPKIKQQIQSWYNNKKQQPQDHRNGNDKKQPRVSPFRWAVAKAYLDFDKNQSQVRSIRFTKKSNTEHQDDQGFLIPAYVLQEDTIWRIPGLGSTKSGHPSAVDCPTRCGGHIARVAHGFCWRFPFPFAGSFAGPAGGSGGYVDCIAPCTVCPVYIKKKKPAVKSYHPWQQNKEYNMFIPQPVYEQGSTRDPRNASQSQPMINILSQGNMTEIKEGYRPTANPIPKGGIQTMGRKTDQARKKTCRQEDSKKWNPNHGQSPTVKMTEIKEGYRPTAEPIPKSGIQIMGRVPFSSRFQRVGSKLWVTDPNNCMPAKFNIKYNAKFNAKSSAMFAVNSNVWLKCLVWRQSSMSSWISEFKAKSKVEFSTKVGFPSLIPSLLPEFDDKINAVPYKSDYAFNSKKN
ncbi:hypothetical protein CLU79DRAFT_890290 [Phycomyces nitens]|nr:hypothetical protein CLU79DRAFT_890290 [Phycomyces nitens]